MPGPTPDQRVEIATFTASWLRAVFVHWRVRPEVIQRLLPPGLVADRYDDAAWVTLTPHLMAAVRPLGRSLLPDLSRLSGRLPDLSNAPEVNLRTYVKGPDGRDGLWFFSLDVANVAVAAAARAFVGAPYFAASIAHSESDGTVRYASRRVGGGPDFELSARLGDPIDPGPLDVWLTGRWCAYTSHLGRLLATPVEHETWPLRSATLDSLTEQLTAPAGLPPVTDPLVHFSPGVSAVRVGRPRVVG
jgi:uncharacterized protein YqjF (DUF2071 family)